MGPPSGPGVGLGVGVGVGSTQGPSSGLDSGRVSGLDLSLDLSLDLGLDFPVIPVMGTLLLPLRSLKLECCHHLCNCASASPFPMILGH